MATVLPLQDAVEVAWKGLAFRKLLGVNDVMEALIHGLASLDNKSGIPFSGERSAHEKNPIIFGKSEKMKEVERMVDQVANTDITVLIRGESGTGKELVAREICGRSSRKNKPFVKVNCAAIPSGLLESELFGFEKGSFTGAISKKPGKFEFANHGTIFLDEISELHPSLQAKLLHVLQDKEFSRLGGDEDVAVDVRVITATNRQIEKELQNGNFREDLYYRINVVSIHLPPLRERKEDILELAEHFLQKYSCLFEKRVSPLSQAVLDSLLSYHWPGNVRELENIIKKVVVLENEELATRDLTSFSRTPGNEHVQNVRTGRPSLKKVGKLAAQEAEKELIMDTLLETRWNRKRAAELLDISYKALLYKIKQSGLSKRRMAV